VANTDGAGALLRAAPGDGRPVTAVREGQTLDVLEQRSLPDGGWLHVRTDTNVDGWVSGSVVQAEAATEETPPTRTSGRSHTVQPGEELRQIATRYDVSVQSLLAANAIPDPDRLRVGQTLAIPDSPNQPPSGPGSALQTRKEGDGQGTDA